MREPSRGLVYSLLFILVVSAVALLVVPRILRPDSPASKQLKELFLREIESKLGRKVEVGEFRLRVFPQIRFEMADLKVWDVDPSHVFLTAKRADFVLRLLPLLRQQVVGKRLTIEEPSIQLRKNLEGTWNVLDPGQGSAASGPALRTSLWGLFFVRDLTIQNGALTITDETHPEVDPLAVKGVDLTVSAQPIRRRADVYLSAVVPGVAGSSWFSLSGTVTPTPSQVPTVSEERSGMLPQFQFEGKAEATNVQLRNLAFLVGPRPVPPQLQSGMNLRGQIRVVPGVVGYDMVLSDLAATVRQIELKGRASLSGLMTDQPTFALTCSSSRVTLQHLFELFPAQWIHDALASVVEKRQIRGAVEIVSATLTGTVMPEPRISLTGEFRVDEVHAIVDDKGTTLSGVAGTVLLEPGRIRGLELSGMYGDLQVGAGKATVSYLDRDATLDLELNGRMAAASLIRQVDPLPTFRSKNLADAWNGLKDIQGVTRVAFRLSGPLDRPDAIRYVSAEFEPQEVSFRTPLLPERVTGLNGRLRISEKGAEFDKLSAWIGQNLVQLQGRIVPDEKNSFQEFTIATRAKAADFLRLLPIGTYDDSTAPGTIGAVVGLSGSLTSPQYKALLDLNAAGLHLPGLGTKPRGRQASMEIDGGFTRTGVHLLHRAALILPSARLTARGTLRLDKRFRINASVGFGPIAVTQLPDWLRPGGLDRGEVEISLELQGRDQDWRNWRITGWVAVTNGALSVAGLRAPVRDLNIRLKLIPNGAELKQFTFALLESEAQISGSVRNWQKKPLLGLTLESPQFDISLLIPKEERSPIRDALEYLAETGRLTATASIKIGTYKMLSISDLSCRVNITNGVVDVDRISGKTSPGQLDGRIVIRLPKGHPASAEAALRLAAVPFEEVVPLFSQRESPLGGTLFLTGSLRGHGRDPRGASHTLSGKANFRIANGRILKDDSRAIWKIISLLNVPAMLQGKVDLNQNGLPFDEITASMNVEQGRVSSDKILVNSPVIKMSAAGSYDIPHDKLDYIVAVSPFGPYSSLLQRIPLFGKLLEGDRQGLATALFAVTGSLNDPQVEYLPIQSVAGGLGGFAKLAVDLLLNLVTLPKEIILPSEDKKPDVDRMPQLETAPTP